VRNVGYVKAAGDVVREAFGHLGSAGGHRSAAKAVIRTLDWQRRIGPLEPASMRQTIARMFVHAMNGKGANGGGAPASQ
jgi:nanoRNase/pAp phosphatase (c-di-AMP/oligoRNAs hydrolase)